MALPAVTRFYFPLFSCFLISFVACSCLFWIETWSMRMDGCSLWSMGMYHTILVTGASFLRDSLRFLKTLPQTQQACKMRCRLEKWKSRICFWKFFHSPSLLLRFSWPTLYSHPLLFSWPPDNLDPPPGTQVGPDRLLPATELRAWEAEANSSFHVLKFAQARRLWEYILASMVILGISLSDKQHIFSSNYTFE